MPAPRSLHGEPAKRLIVTVPESEAALLEMAASRQSRSVSETMRTALREYLARFTKESGLPSARTIMHVQRQVMREVAALQKVRPELSFEDAIDELQRRDDLLPED